MNQSLKNQKGFSLTELLVALLLISMTSVLLTQMLSFNISSTNAFSQYNNQQFTINNASIRLRKDIERAIKISADAVDNIGGNDYRKIKLTIEGEIDDYSWKIDEQGKLLLNGTTVIDNLGVGSKFICTNDCLAVVLIPKPTKAGKHSINVAKPIISQYGIKYKH